MVLVNVQNQVFSPRVTVRNANKMHSTSKPFKVGVLFYIVFCLFLLIFSQEKLRRNLQIRG